MKTENKKFKSGSQNSVDDAALFDVIVIGGGAAGLSAASWCDELGLKTALLESGAELGGQLLSVYNPIRNHLGAVAENGRALRDVFVGQCRTRAFKIFVNSKIVEVDAKKKSVVLENGEKFAARALVIATGVRRRRLGVGGEERFKNRGVIESGKRAAKTLAGKTVAVIGGGDAALENALILSEAAAKVFLVHRGKNFRGRAEFLEQVLKNEKVEILTETVVTEIGGDEAVDFLKLKNLETQEEFNLPADAVLLRIGVEPNTELFRGKLNLDKYGYIETNANGETSAENVFAAGDAVNRLAPTISSAVGTGATAAKVIFAKLNS